MLTLRLVTYRQEMSKEGGDNLLIEREGANEKQRNRCPPRVLWGSGVGLVSIAYKIRSVRLRAVWLGWLWLLKVSQGWSRESRLISLEGRV